MGHYMEEVASRSAKNSWKILQIKAFLNDEIFCYHFAVPCSFLYVFLYFTNFNRYGRVLIPTPIVYSHILQEEGSFTFHQNVQGQIGIMILEDLGGKMSLTALAGCLGKPERFE